MNLTLPIHCRRPSITARATLSNEGDSENDTQSWSWGKIDDGRYISTLLGVWLWALLIVIENVILFVNLSCCTFQLQRNEECDNSVNLQVCCKRLVILVVTNCSERRQVTAARLTYLPNLLEVLKSSWIKSFRNRSFVSVLPYFSGIRIVA